MGPIHFEIDQKTKKTTPATSHSRSNTRGSKATFLIEPFVLPHQQDWSSPEEFKNASGPANWNQQQGFYIYRSGRMSQSGGWCRLRTADEHSKLARVALSFFPSLDEAFRVNVTQIRVQLPAQVRDQIRAGHQTSRDAWHRTHTAGNRTVARSAVKSATPVRSAECLHHRHPRRRTKNRIRRFPRIMAHRRNALWTIDEVIFI